jgi:ferrous iron transport protein A
MTLDELAVGECVQVDRVTAHIGEGVSAGLNAMDIAARLEDIGFTPGETVSVLTRAVPGGDPMVVRVGQSRFALRRVEARCVQVRADETGRAA